ncbi:MAG: M23 family metallopeptidase [Bacteroidota bacterium]
MAYRISLILIVASGFFGLSSTPYLKPSSKPHSSESTEQIYAPFDTLRTDLRDYHWPTVPYLRITSAFADVRSFHFHAGIDISTNRRKGYEVFASRSGYVSRIWISPYGYGKIIFIRHPDGFTTTYAHLQHFKKEIDDFVRLEQYKNEKYSLDLTLTPDQFPVQQGDVIAYTGDTGVGLPHLHFEIRDESLNPVDPLLFPGIASYCPDRIAPAFREISFSPLTSSTLIQGDTRSWTADIRKISGSEFQLPGILHLSGNIGISIKAVDWIGTSYYPNRANQYEVYVDDSLLFSSSIVRFPARDMKQIAVHYDWTLNREGKGYFQKLFVEPGNHLPFYARQPEGAGVLETEHYAEGFHALKIVTKDVSGNKSQLRATLAFSHPPSIDVSMTEGKLLVSRLDSGNLQVLSVGSSQGSSKSMRRVDPSRLVSNDGRYEIPHKYLTRNIVKVVAENRFGTPSRPHFVLLDPPRSSNTSLRIDKEFMRDFVYITVKSHLPFTLRPSVWVSLGNRRELLDISALEANKYAGTFPLRPEDSGPLRIQATADINGASLVEAFDESAVSPITPEEGGTIESGDFRITFPVDGVFQTLYCRVEKSSGCYEVYPSDVVLNEGAIVECRIPPLETGTRVGLFHDNGEGWELIDRTAVGQKEVLSGRVDRLLGEFAVLEDNTPPTISGIRISPMSKKLRVTFRLWDNLAGTAPDSIHIRVDGQLLIGEYDPYNRLVTFDDVRELPPGSHELSIEAQDRLGNKSFALRSFHTK